MAVTISDHMASDLAGVVIIASVVLLLFYAFLQHASLFLVKSVALHPTK